MFDQRRRRSRYRKLAAYLYYSRNFYSIKKPVVKAAPAIPPKQATRVIKRKAENQKGQAHARQRVSYNDKNKRPYELFVDGVGNLAVKVAKHFYDNSDLYQNIYHGVTGRVKPFDRAAYNRHEAIMSRRAIDQLQDRIYNEL